MRERPERAANPAPATTTPAMHITPNVVTTARGGATLQRSTSFSDASQARALHMRNLRL